MCLNIRRLFKGLVDGFNTKLQIIVGIAKPTRHYRAPGNLKFFIDNSIFYIDHIQFNGSCWYAIYYSSAIPGIIRRITTISPVTATPITPPVARANNAYIKVFKHSKTKTKIRMAVAGWNK